MTDWTVKRAALVDRWDRKSPMTKGEMWGAVERDRKSSPVDGHYDRRGLLNVVAALLDEAEAAASVRAELAEKVRALPNPYDTARDNQGMAAMVGYNFALEDVEAILATPDTGVPSPHDPAPDVSPVPGPDRPTS